MRLEDLGRVAVLGKDDGARLDRAGEARHGPCGAAELSLCWSVRCDDRGELSAGNAGEHEGDLVRRAVGVQGLVDVVWAVCGVGAELAQELVGERERAAASGSTTSRPLARLPGVAAFPPTAHRLLAREAVRRLK